MAGLEDSAVILAALNQTVAAINDLAITLSELVLSVNVEPADPAITVNCTPSVVVNCSPCGSSGTEVEGGSGDQGQTPPPGYTAPDPETPDRKCKVANMIHDGIASMVNELAILDADAYAQLGYALTLGLVGAAIGSILPGAGTLVGGLLESSSE